MTTSNALAALREHFKEDDLHWTTGTWGNSSGSYCLIGGLRVMCGSNEPGDIPWSDDGYAEYVRCTEKLYECLPEDHKESKGYLGNHIDVLITYNDKAKGRDEVIELIECAISKVGDE